MSKAKSSSKSGKPAKADILTKVKDAAIVKPAQQVKAKGQEIAKTIAGKEDKKAKKSKKIREPTPESSDESEEVESSESSESSSSESESEQPSKSSLNGKANGAKKASKPDAGSGSESDESSDAESSEEETLVNGGKTKSTTTSKTAAGIDASDSDEASASSSDESDEDEKSTAKTTTKVVAPKSADKKSNKSENSSEPDNSDESQSSEEDSADEEEAAQPTGAKRKAEQETAPVAKKPKTTDSAAAQSANLFVGNLSWNVDDAWLREAFEEFGELSRVQLMTDRATGRSKGFGYVEFVNADDAAKAHSAKQGAELDGRPMNVDFANARPNTQDRQDNRRKSYGDQLSEPSDTLFLGNLSFDVGQEAVTEAFSPHGTVLGIRLPTDRETGQPKGYGYVTFTSIDEATGALEAMQGSYIAGRPIRLDYSQPRPQYGDSPARGGRGGFGGRGGGGRGGGGRGGGRGGRGGRGGFNDRRGGRGGAPRTNTTNRGGFGDFSGSKVSFD